MIKVTIIGSGSAGAVLASRLSEQKKFKVTLLEAGPDYFGLPLPADLGDGSRNSMLKHDWGFKHRPTTQQIRFMLPRGKVVGGSSAVNTCIALRGDKYDYDEWADRGLPQWSFNKVLKYFKKLENDLDYDRLEKKWHNNKGPLPIRRFSEAELSPWQLAFLEACAIKGYPVCHDTNAPGAHGYGSHAMNLVNGRRISVAEAYLTTEIRSRKNLEILSHSLVHRIKFHKNRAEAVEVERTGELREIKADLIILSAGAINSPGILYRSGIGPAEKLEKMGVRVRHENQNIGRRLLDHPGCAIILKPRMGAPTSRKHQTIQTTLRYGSSLDVYNNDMTMQPGANMMLPWFNAPLLSIMCMVGKSHGTGEISWPDASPHSKPIVNSKLFENKHDRYKGVESMQLAFELAQTKPMRKLARHLFPLPRTLRSLEKTHRWIRKATDSGYHPCGTIPMGGPRDQEAATDFMGRPHGLTNLVVADASIMPTVPSANINLATIMIGERMADLIKAKY